MEYKSLRQKPDVENAGLQQYQPITTKQEFAGIAERSASESHASIRENHSLSAISALSRNNSNITGRDRTEQSESNPAIQRILQRTDSNSSLGSARDLFKAFYGSSRALVALPAGSLKASVFTVITGCVGGGTLTLSYGIKMAGTVPSFFYLTMITLAQAYTTYILVIVAEYNGCQSFRSLAKKLYGKTLARIVQFNLLIMLWSIAVSYMTFTKNLIGDAIQQLINKIDGRSDGSKWYDNNILLLSLLLMGIITPLALKKKISALRYSSLFGFFSVLYTVVIVSIIYFVWCDEHDQHQPQKNRDRECLFDVLTVTKTFDSNFLNHTYTIAIMMGGFCCQPTILPIYFQMKGQSPSLLVFCLMYSFGMIFTLYVCVAYFGYFTFPNDVQQNLLSSDYENNVFILIAEVLLSLYVVMIIPLFAHAFRTSAAQILVKKDKREGPAERKLMRSNEEKSDALELPPFKHVAVTMGYLLTSYAVACVADNIGTVNAFISSTTLPFTCFIIPAMFVARTPQISSVMKWITYILCFLATANSLLQLGRQVMEFS